MAAKDFIVENYPVTAKDFENKKCAGLYDIAYICEKYHENEVKNLSLFSVSNSLMENLETKLAKEKILWLELLKLKLKLFHYKSFKVKKEYFEVTRDGLKITTELDDNSGCIIIRKDEDVYEKIKDHYLSFLKFLQTE